MVSSSSVLSPGGSGDDGVRDWSNEGDHRNFTSGLSCNLDNDGKLLSDMVYRLKYDSGRRRYEVRNNVDVYKVFQATAALSPRVSGVRIFRRGSLSLSLSII